MVVAFYYVWLKLSCSVTFSTYQVKSVKTNETNNYMQNDKKVKTVGKQKAKQIERFQRLTKIRRSQFRTKCFFLYCLSFAIFVIRPFCFHWLIMIRSSCIPHFRFRFSDMKTKALMSHTNKFQLIRLSGSRDTLAFSDP